MTTDKKISDAVIRRLPRYYRTLCELESEGVVRISSKLLSERMLLTASQIRHDFNCFGGFGQQGYGYHVLDLKRQIAKILGLGIKYKMIIAGAGNIGRALANYNGFSREGFTVAGLFDIDKSLIGQNINGCPVQDMADMEAFIAKEHPQIAAICTPGAAAQAIAKRLEDAGICAIWNFSPIDVHLEKANVENVGLSDSLFVLAYRLQE